jgi:hypothetical protein
MVEALAKLSKTVYGRFEEQKKRDIKRVYAKMSAKEKETLTWRMAKIIKAGTGNKENTPPCCFFLYHYYMF